MRLTQLARRDSTCVSVSVSVQFGVDTNRILLGRAGSSQQHFVVVTWKSWLFSETPKAAAGKSQRLRTELRLRLRNTQLSLSLPTDPEAFLPQSFR